MGAGPKRDRQPAAREPAAPVVVPRAGRTRVLKPAPAVR